MKCIYVYHNKFVGYYADPFVADVEKDKMPEMVRRMIWLDLENAKKNHMDETELVYLGTFDDEKGVILLAEEKEVICDCSSIFAQRLKFEKGEA